MKVLVVGSGGRESAIIWKLSQSKKVNNIYCAPGNAHTSHMAENVNISAMDIEALLDFVISRSIDFTVIGPDDPLGAGIVDAFLEKGLKVFGPEKKAAIVEWSKTFSKDFMKRNNIPTAAFANFDDKDAAVQYIKGSKFPLVVKADGLAVGKGVYICENEEEAFAAVDELMVQAKFGASGDKIVVEEFLKGVEVSVLSFVDGKTVVPMLSSKDHKAIYNGNKGPNTGGMGTVAPNPDYSDDMAKRCYDEIFKPTVDALAKEGREFKGVLFFGLMLTEDGPKVIEYNARFGDPEAQVVLPMMDSDLLDIMLACCDGKLHEMEINWKDGAAVCVILASDGYPGKYETGYEIHGLSEIENKNDALVFGAGVKNDGEKTLTSGGRVLGVTAFGNNVSEASKKAYEYAEKIKFDNKYCRTDIGIN